MEKINGLDLFTGIGGITIALSDWVCPIGYCEIDPFCRAVLFNRMQEGLLPFAPIWDDVKTLQPNDLPRRIDIIYGGFPCQDISLAGMQAGLGGARSGLFFEIIRLATLIQPAFLFLENVAGIFRNGIQTVLEEITKAGYDCRYGILSARDVGAPHQRERWFLLAHARSQRLEGVLQAERKEHMQSTVIFTPRRSEKWITEPNVVRVVNGIPLRMDRTKALGNSVVPDQAKQAFQMLMGLTK